MEFDGCYTETDWFAYQPGVVNNITVEACAERCYTDGFPFAGMRTVVQEEGVPNESGCECGCNTDGLVSTNSSLCTATCTLFPETTFDFSCPTEDGFMALFSVQVPTPFCDINPICEEATQVNVREMCTENLTLVYALVISILVILIVGGAVFCFMKRRTFCRARRGPSQSMKRQILQDQLIGEISAGSLVQQVNQSWVIDFHKITMGKMIAAGSSGQVYAGVFDGKPVAVKELFSVLFDPESLKDFKDEVSRAYKNPTAFTSFENVPIRH